MKYEIHTDAVKCITYLQIVKLYVNVRSVYFNIVTQLLTISRGIT